MSSMRNIATLIWSAEQRENDDRRALTNGAISALAMVDRLMPADRTDTDGVQTAWEAQDLMEEVIAAEPTLFWSADEEPTPAIFDNLFDAIDVEELTWGRE